MAALKYWVWLTTLPGLTNRSKLLLLEHFPSPEDIYYAQPEDLPPVEGLSSSQAARLSDKSTDRAEDVLARCAKGDIFLLTMQDQNGAMLNTHIYGSGKDLLDLLRVGTGGNVHIMDGPP